MRIRWTPAAAADLQSISDYLKEHHPHYRQPTMRKLYETIRSLKQAPYVANREAWKAPEKFCSLACPISAPTASTNGSGRLKFCASITAHRTGPKKQRCFRFSDNEVSSRSRPQLRRERTEIRKCLPQKEHGSDIAAEAPRPGRTSDLQSH